MIRPNTNVDEVISLLNEALSCDAWAVQQLIDNRIPCSLKLRDHPTIQCGQTPVGSPSVGMLGILNGIFGTHPNGYGAIKAIYDDRNRLIKFARYEP